MKGDITCGQAA